MRVLVLSTTTGYQLRSFGEAAERLGMELMFATDRCGNLDDPWRDAAVAVRFHDPVTSLEAIVQASRRAPIDGVIAVGDRPVVLAALAAEVLGVRGNPPGAAAASSNKVAARQKFAEAGLNVPRFRTVKLAGAGFAVRGSPFENVRFPCVVKPLGLSGSRGVIRADTRAGLERAATRVAALLRRKEIRIIRAGLEDEILIEDFIPGREYAIEGVVTGGVVQVFAVFDKPDPLDGPFFEETIYLTPSAMSDRERRAVIEQMQRGVYALGLRNGPVHAECRVGPQGIFVLEIAARPIGGLCSRVLRFGKRGQAPFSQNRTEKGACPLFTLEEILLRHATGDDVSGYTREPDAAGVMMIPIPRRGIYKSVQGEADARAVAGIEDVRITAKPDQLLEALPEAGSYLGFIFARAPHASRVDAALREAHRRLTFMIDPAIDLYDASARVSGVATSDVRQETSDSRDYRD